MSTDMNKMVDKFKALGLGEKIILIAALVLFIDGFLPWYSGGGCAEYLGQKICASASANGWAAPGAIWSIFAILIGLTMAGVILVKNLAKEGTIPANISGITWPKIYLGAGAAACLLVLIKLLSHSGDLDFGFFLAIISVAALAAGGFLMYKDEMAASGGGGTVGTG